MTVKELIAKLQTVPQDAEIEVAKGPSVISAPATHVLKATTRHIIIWAQHD